MSIENLEVVDVEILGMVEDLRHGTVEAKEGRRQRLWTHSNV